MTRFDPTSSLATLAGFQRTTVDHVTRRFYTDPDPTRRFLVADETGLGKSLVARGVVARTIEVLQDDPSVARIDIVYVCSNAEIARQNVKRLDVIGRQHDIATRLTLLARGATALDGDAVGADKAVNLVSFTPGTLPGRSWQTGTLDERALIHVILSDHLCLDGPDARSSMLVFQGTVIKRRTVEERVWWTREEAARHGGVEHTIAEQFVAQCEKQGLLEEYRQCLADTRGRRTHLPDEVQARAGALIARFRTEIARAGVEALEPDLIILDEFQRFRELLDPAAGTEAAELARALFDFGNAKVLLLSATPIKSFTLAEEAAAGDDHELDLRRLLRFLTDGSELDPAIISADLAEYRRCAIKGLPVGVIRGKVETGLLSVMCRTERPRVGAEGQLAEEDHPVGPIPPKDLIGWVGLHGLAAALGAPVSLDYWKSAPYFANFLDGYKLGDRLRERLREVAPDESVRNALQGVQALDHAAVEARRELDLGSARLRALAAKTVDKDLHLLLWVPPSLAYHRLDGPYRDVDPIDCTKQLVFSSWAATPTAVASLLSYEADRRIDTPASTVTRLEFRTEGDRPGAMTTLALFWPNPGLATICDPLHLADPEQDPEDVETVRSRAEALLTDRLPAGVSSRASTAEAGYWQTAIGSFGPLPDGLADPDALVAALTGQIENNDEPDAPSRIRLHVELALRTTGPAASEDLPPQLAGVVAQLGLHAPGNIAWRALGRLLRPGHQVTPAGHWKAAATLASGFRSLFNRAEAIGILDRLLPPETVYWRAVLTYCAWGDLQAVLDEHLHHIAISEGVTGLPDDKTLLGLAQAVRATLALRPSPLSAFDPYRPQHRIAFPSRFALRYGTARQSDEAIRLPEVRAAFNSPFWPWVLATTSVGQEGLDFHWWCNSIVHWNTPANPVDFEQREGRVNRYGGLAIRRNLADRHRAEILRTGADNPWDTAYELGLDERTNLGQLAPHWVYPGRARIHRTVLPFPLSTDGARYRRLKDDLALYRLTFGQPRQEDLLEILRRRGVQHDVVRADELRLRLEPPTFGSASSSTVVTVDPRGEGR